MRRKSLLMLVLLTVANLTAWAQDPNDSGTYYQKANGKTGASLKTALSDIINPHTKIGYDGLYEAYKKTDTRADGYVRDWYSNSTSYTHVTDKAGSYSKEGDCYNREHSVPQSWFDGSASKSYITCDVVHVVPTDGYVNNRRSNYPLAEVSNVTYSSNNNYCKLGSCKTSGYSGTVFEPNDEIKGDMARMYFYMVTSYESEAAGWAHDVFSSDNNGFETWVLDMLMRWSKQDPIDAVEIARNNAVYEVQSNRNPFVDYPGLEDYIWGSKQNVVFSYDNYDASEVATVAMPVFTPDAGTYYNKVDVTISCATDGATIYYTTDGADASEQSILYEGTITLTESATIKAIAIKDGQRSVQAIANYVINGSSSETPTGGEYDLNNTFFNYSGSGVIDNKNTEDLIGSTNGITVVYSLGSGSQRYANETEIRLYTGNQLTVSANGAEISEIVFTIGKKTDTLKANTGNVNGYTWTGAATSVEFTSGGNLSLAKMKITLAQESSGIDELQNDLSGQRVIFNLRGQRVVRPTQGLYIVDGKKILIK